MANYLITGGCGFIGSHLAESLLQDGHGVRILDDLSTGKLENVPVECEIVIDDVANSSIVRKSMRDMDGCFHLAAIASVQKSTQHWVRSHRVNQSGTINVLEAARVRKPPVVYASSAAVYGDNADMPLTESSVVRPLTAYGADKLGSEQHARVASLEHGVPTAGMRFFNVYGPRQDPSSPYSGVISIFVDHLLRAESLVIFGDGQQTRDFVYVGDVVRFLRAGMVHADLTSAVFNVCTGQSITVNQLARTLMSITRKEVSIIRQPSRKGDIRISIGDPSYAKQQLNMLARHSLAQGLQEFIGNLTVESEKSMQVGYLAGCSR